VNGYEIRFTRSAEKEFDDFSTKLRQRLAAAMTRFHSQAIEELRRKYG
jgi:hypothetical protein